MNEKFELRIDVQEFVVSGDKISISLPFSLKEDKKKGGDLTYLPQLLPKRGRYNTSYNMTLIISEEKKCPGCDINNNISVCEFTGEYIEKRRTAALRLKDLNSEETIGVLRDPTGFLPEEMIDGNEYFVTIKLNYPYEEKLKEKSAEELRERRETFQERLEEFREKYL